jgi:hypothetical protein
MGTGNDADVLVRGVFRTGNLNGQGGVAMIGRVPAVTEEERS